MTTDSAPVAGRRRLIVNADDFGQSSGINRGVARAHENGIVTSASLMVRWPGAVEAAVIARRHARLSLGLHVDLGEWEHRDGTWQAIYTVVDTDDEAAVRREVAVQLERFREMTGAEPTHVDSHQHVHRGEPVASVVEQLASELGVPLRERTSRVRYCGDFYGQSAHGRPLSGAITVARLVQIVIGVPDGITELSCHPAAEADVASPYRHERVKELDVLCDPRLRDELERLSVELISFHQLAASSAR